MSVTKSCWRCNHRRINHIDTHCYRVCNTCKDHSNFDHDGYDKSIEDLEEQRTFNIPSEHVEITKQGLSEKEFLEKELSESYEALEIIKGYLNSPLGLPQAECYIDYHGSVIKSIKTKLLMLSQPNLYDGDFYTYTHTHTDDKNPDEIKRVIGKWGEVPYTDPVSFPSITVKRMGLYNGALAHLKGFFR